MTNRSRTKEDEARYNFFEPVNLYTAALLEPGNRKSAVFSDATRPLRDVEAELIEVARPVVARAHSDRRQQEGRLKRLEKIAAEKEGSEGAGARHEAGDLAAKLAEAPEPVLPRLMIDDATPERIAMILEEQRGRIASMSPEGGVFDLMAGRYSKNGAPNFDVYLKGHAGDDVVQDRVTRESVRVERPAITCVYAMQPQVIQGVAVNPAFRGRGLLARFLYAYPKSKIGYREIAPDPVPPPVREAYHQVVQTLAPYKEDFILQLTAEAADAFIDWETEVEGMLRDGSDLELIRDWGSKLVGVTLRLAAVMHCLKHGVAGRIEGETIAAAVTIARHLIPHADAVLNLVLAPQAAEDDAHYVLRWIENEHLCEFSKRDAHQHGRRRFPKADDLNPALAKLARRGYIRQRVVAGGGPGRPSSPEYEVNPGFFERSSTTGCTHNPHNSAPPRPSGNSADNEDTFVQSQIPKQARVTV